MRGLDQIQICGYQEGICYENAALVAEAIGAKGVDLDRVRVLYVSRLGHYNVHAIVVHDGKVFDATKFRSSGGTVDVKGIPVREYFASTYSDPDSMVLDIDSRHYIRLLPKATNGRFGDQLFGRAARDTFSRRLSLREYLRRLSTEPSTR